MYKTLATAGKKPHPLRMLGNNMRGPYRSLPVSEKNKTTVKISTPL